MFNYLRKTISLTLIAAFITSSLYIPKVQAGEMVVPVMPTPGTLVHLSPIYTPAYLKGIVIHPDNALKFDFLIHKGEGNLDESQKKQEYTKLIKYFLAALTVPDKDQWVNLSPYEKNRIVENDFGKTEMGRDLLSQDYLLKQITSSLMYPESGLGKDFWGKVYERAFKEYGTTDIPVNTFNKVWIVPDQALIYESGNTAYVVNSHLKVMLEEDYLSLKKHTAIESPDPKQNAFHSVSSKVIREVILPEIEKEVNTGKNFAMLRQVFSGMLLATWYKKALKESLLGQVYADKARVQGVDQNPKNNEAIYQKYLVAFKKGVYNYIKEDAVMIPGMPSKERGIFPRKYFAGGYVNRDAEVMDLAQVSNEKMNAAMADDKAPLTEDLAAVVVDQAQAASGFPQPYQDMKTMYKGLPIDIKNIMAQTGLLDSVSLAATVKLTAYIGTIYNRLKLLIKNYHNNLHNMVVTYGSLVLATNAGLIESKRDLLVTFLAGESHDFHLRVVRPFGEQKPASPALVDETLGTPDLSRGGQLPDLLGINGFAYNKDNPAIPNANYLQQITGNDKKEIRRLFAVLAQGDDPQEIYTEVNAIIRRTDFASDLPQSEKPIYKQLADEIRDFMDAQAAVWIASNREVTDKDVNDLIRQVQKKYRQVFKDINEDKELDAIKDGKAIATAWVTRQRYIELNFLNALLAVKAERRLKVYQIANRVELADQSASIWLAGTELNKEITLGLREEIPFVSVEANYPLFYVPQFLSARVLAKLRDLPFDYKVDFIKKMEYFAKYSTDFAKKELEQLTEPDRSKKLEDHRFQLRLNSENDWNGVTRDRVLSELNLYEENGVIKEEEKQNAELVRALRRSIIGKTFSLLDIHKMVANGAVTRRIFKSKETIIKRGDSADNDWYYIIASGEVTVLTNTEDSGKKIMRAGDNFGELAFISGLRRNATITANTPTVLVRMRGSTLHALLLTNKAFRDELYNQAIPNRLRAEQKGILHPWANPNIVMTMKRENSGWQSPELAAENEITSYHLLPNTVYFTVRSILSNTRHPDDIRQVKMITIADASLNERTPLVSIYQDPVDQKKIIVFSSKLFTGDKTVIEVALDEALDHAMKTVVVERAFKGVAEQPFGGIDLNSANLNLRIKRDGNGVPLPISQQDMAQLSNIRGFVPRILEIKSVSETFSY